MRVGSGRKRLRSTTTCCTSAGANIQAAPASTTVTPASTASVIAMRDANTITASEAASKPTTDATCVL